jgi:hypothetical protein
MDYEEGDPIPPGYHKRTRIRKGMVAAGAATFGALYVFSLLFAAAGDGICSAQNDQCKYGWRDLYIPVAGPFIAIHDFGPGGGTAPLVIDGVGQAAGLALLIGGIAAQETQLVRNDISKPHVFFTPRVARNSTGFGIAGTF